MPSHRKLGQLLCLLGRAWDVALGRKAETRLCVWGAVYAHALLQWPSELQKTQSLG